MIKFDVNKEVTSKLRFEPLPAFNKLCIGKLMEVRVDENEAPTEDRDGNPSTWEFAGCMLPTLVFAFENHIIKGKTDDFERHYEMRESIIGNQSKDRSDMDKKKVANFYENMWDRVKHIHDAYEKEPNFKAIKTLPDIDESVAPNERAKQFKKFFEAIAKLFNEGTDKKPIFLTPKGLPIVMFMKLVATYASQGKALGFDSYVKDGFIQKFLMVNGQPVTSLKIKGNETVELAAGKVAKTMATTSDAAPAGFSQDVAPEVLAALNQAGQ